MGYAIVKEFNIPEELMRPLVKPEVLLVDGYKAEDLPPPGTLIARVELIGAKFGTHWFLEAIVRIGHRIMDFVKVGEIKFDGGTALHEILPSANDWIRAGETATDAPEASIRRRINSDSYTVGVLVMGVMLYRG